jgi:hypothetical protein
VVSAAMLLHEVVLSAALMTDAESRIASQYAMWDSPASCNMHMQGLGWVHAVLRGTYAMPSIGQNQLFFLRMCFLCTHACY